MASLPPPPPTHPAGRPRPCLRHPDGAPRRRRGAAARHGLLLVLLLLVAGAPAALPADVPAPAAAATTQRLLCGFESAQETALFELRDAASSERHATQGHHSLRVAAGGSLSSWRLPGDWSAWDSLEIDAYVESPMPLPASILIADQAWKAHGSSYWDRHNRELTLPPGASVIRVPVHGLWRGEAGSRGNALRTPIDPAHILRFDLGIGPGPAGAAVYLDDVRLVRTTHPPGLLAFSFGPPEESGGEGFVPITWNTVHGRNGAAAGLEHPCPNANRARNDTYPTRLYESSVWFEEDGNAFVADVPNGRWQVWVVFNDCGYWGGEEAQFTRRSILANGQVVDVEERPLGRADALFRFEQCEPLPGADLWNLYVAPLFTPRRGAVQVTDGHLRLAIHSDAPWSSRVAAIVLYPEPQRVAAEAWLAGLETRNQQEFASRAVCLDAPRTLAVPAAAQAQGWWLGYPRLEDTITADGPPGPAAGPATRPGIAGETVGLTVAVRPLRDLGAVEGSVSDLTGPTGTLAGRSCELRYAQYQARRGASDLAYTIVPGPLPRLAGSGLRLASGVTRAFWVLVPLPAQARPGHYTGTLTLATASATIAVPLAIDVLPVQVSVPSYPMGFLGASVPAELPADRAAHGWADLAGLLARSGMTSLSGGPSIRLTGFAPDGSPTLAYGACDAYFATLAAAGLTGPVYGYGGPAAIEGLLEGPQPSHLVTAEAVRRGEEVAVVVGRVVGAVAAHARQAGWPRVYRSCIDEPRTLAGAQRCLALAQLWAKAAPEDPLGGFYSVDWQDHTPFATTMQQLFAALPWSGLNAHQQIDLDRARALGREVHCYNQGLDRYTFGMYQWAEWRKGVRGFLQWNVLALHGWQFNDLDGREPDTGVVNWGSRELIPSLALLRTGAGAWDFRCAWTLWARAQAQPTSPAAHAALAYLDGIDHGIPAGARRRPPGMPDDDGFRARVCALLAALPPGP